MPYLKPEEAYRLQMIAVTAEEYIADGYYEADAVDSAMRKCPICGDKNCDKSIVEANNVWVHPEDVAAADSRENPRLKNQ